MFAREGWFLRRAVLADELQCWCGVGMCVGGAPYPSNIAKGHNFDEFVVNRVDVTVTPLVAFLGVVEASHDVAYVSC